MKKDVMSVANELIDFCNKKGRGVVDTPSWHKIPTGKEKQDKDNGVRDSAGRPTFGVQRIGQCVVVAPYDPKQVPNIAWMVFEYEKRPFQNLTFETALLILM
jgi:hypothetical protein